MNIQDFFYFPSGDRRALSVVFLLMLIGWLLFYCSNPPTPEPVALTPPTAPADTVRHRDIAVPDSQPKVKKQTTPVSRPTPERRQFYTPHVSNKYPKGTVVELNSTDTASLRRVPGIGPVFARRIVRFRELLGGFYSVAQLREVYGMDEERYRSLAPWFRIDTSGITPLRVNQVSCEELARHPYVSNTQARILCRLRKQNGHLRGWADLSLLEEFAAPQHRRLRYYLSFE